MSLLRKRAYHVQRLAGAITSQQVTATDQRNEIQMPYSSRLSTGCKCGRGYAFATIFVMLVAIIPAACEVDADSTTGTISSRQAQFSQIHIASSDDIQKYDLVGEILNDEEVLGDIGMLAVVGEYVIVGDSYLSPAIHVIRRSDGLVAGQVGRPGEGPGEYMSVWRILPLDDNSFAVYDFVLRRFTSYSVENMDASVQYQRLLFEGYPIGVGIVGDHFIATGLFSQGRIQVADQSGNPMRFIGSPPSGPRGTPVQVRQHAHHGVIATRPGSTQFVIANRYADELEFFQLDNTEAILAKGPADIHRVYKVKNNNGIPSMLLGADARHGYLDVAASNKYVYALFSGRKVDETNSIQCRTIHVYDWHGRLVRMLALNIDVTDIAVSQDDEYLYAVKNIPGPAVVVFDMGAEPHNSL